MVLAWGSRKAQDVSGPHLSYLIPGSKYIRSLIPTFFWEKPLGNTVWCRTTFSELKNALGFTGGGGGNDVDKLTIEK